MLIFSFLRLLHVFTLLIRQWEINIHFCWCHWYVSIMIFFYNLVYTNRQRAQMLKKGRATQTMIPDITGGPYIVRATYLPKFSRSTSWDLSESPPKLSPPLVVCLHGTSTWRYNWMKIFFFFSTVVLNFLGFHQTNQRRREHGPELRWTDNISALDEALTGPCLNFLTSLSDLLVAGPLELQFQILKVSDLRSSLLTIV